jgi:antitoxin VapB
MALNIKSEEADRLARELAAETGETITDAVTVALSERLKRVKRPKDEARKARLRAIVELARSAKPIDDTPDDEILGYNEIGAFD